MATERRRVVFRGLVQGVYFRDTVRQIALNYAVAGFVRNVAYDRVELEAEGEPAVVAAFIDDILAHPPPAARVDDVQSETIAATGQAGFKVTSSTGRYRQ